MIITIMIMEIVGIVIGIRETAGMMMMMIGDTAMATLVEIVEEEMQDLWII